MTSLDLLFAALALGLGVAMARTTLCTVANLQQWVHARRVDGLLRLLAVACAAGLVLLALQRLAPSMVRLPMAMPVTVSVVFGGMLLGLGALVNGACFLGTVLYVGRGNANFLATLAGLVLGLRWSAPMSLGAAGTTMTTMTTVSSAAVTMPGAAAVAAALVLFVGGLLAAALAVRRLPGDSSTLRSSLLAAVASGTIAGGIYAGHPDWNYASALNHLARPDGRSLFDAGELAGLLVLAGATLGSLGIRRWQLEPLRGQTIARCLAGGALMALGARLIPGGHDLLLMWSIPGLALHGLVAFLAMALTVASLLSLGRDRASGRPVVGR